MCHQPSSTLQNTYIPPSRRQPPPYSLSTSTSPSNNNSLLNDTVIGMVNKAVENAVEKSVVKQVTAVVRAEVANAVNIAVKAVLRDRESNQKMSNHVDSDFSGNEGSSKNVAGGSVRYLPVTQQEVDSVKSAIYGVTWRSCHKGHLFAVGDCGQPAERGTCLECKISVGR